MCQFSETMKKNCSFTRFSTSLGRGIVVLSISIMCNILKITSQCLIQILALLMPHFDVVPRLPPSSSVFVNFPVKSNTVHGIAVALLSMTPSNIDLTDCAELDVACILVVSHFCLFYVVIKQTEKTRKEFCVFSETLLCSSTKCTVIKEYSKVFKAKEEHREGQWNLNEHDFKFFKGIFR